jgi:hypothetical protein
MTAKKHIHPADLVLRCIALKRGGYWVAMCIDLDLAVQADTLAQARKQLRGQISSYVADATGVDSEHARTLLGRKAPLRYFAMYYYAKFIHSAKKVLSFDAAMPLTPATA